MGPFSFGFSIDNPPLVSFYNLDALRTEAAQRSGAGLAKSFRRRKGLCACILSI